MRVNELRGYEDVKESYHIKDGKLYNGKKELKGSVVSQNNGLKIELDLEEIVKELNPADKKVEVYRDGRLFYTLPLDVAEIAGYLKLPAGKFSGIFKDGLSYRGYTFKII